MNFICCGGKVNVSTLNVGDGWEVVVSVNTEDFRVADVLQVLREREFNEYNVDSGKVKVFAKHVDVEEMVEMVTNLSVDIVKAVGSEKDIT